MSGVSAIQLEAFIARAFESVGLPATDARSVAQLMALADVQGSEGHGVFRLPQYIRRIKAGAVNVKPNIRIEREAAAMALVDGDNGNDPALVRQTDAATDYNADPNADSAWCSFYDASLASTPSALTPVGTYRFLLRMTLEPAPGQIFLQGTERCGHKVAFNGTYRK